MTGPLDELVQRILRRVEAFKQQHGLSDAEVSLELLDGSLHRLKSLSAEPGFGFLSFCPHCDDDDPQELIVPLGAVREIRIGAPEHEQPLGFGPAPGPATGSVPGSATGSVPGSVPEGD